MGRWQAVTWKLDLSADVCRARCPWVRTWGCLPIRVLSTHRRKASQALCRGAFRAFLGQPPWPQLMLCLSPAPAALESAKSSEVITRVQGHHRVQGSCSAQGLSQASPVASDKCLMVLRSSAFLQRAVRIPHTSICVG